MWKCRGMVQMRSQDTAELVLILHSKPASSLAFLAEREKIKCKNLFFSSFPRKNRLVSRDLPFICCEAAHVLYSKIKNQFLDASPNSLSFTVIKGPARSTSCSVLRWSRTSLGGQTTPGPTLLLQNPYERSNDSSWCLERPHQGLACLGEGCNLKCCLWASL